MALHLLLSAWSYIVMTMTRRTLALVSVVMLGFGFQATAIPTVTINDTTGPITVSASSGFSTFSSGSILGSSEAVWWHATGVNLGSGMTSGIWTDPGGSKISDEYFVVDSGTEAYGVFLSDPSTLPAVITIPGVSTPIDLGLFLSTSPETGKPTQISPDPTSLSVVATSSIPDAGSTIILLGLALVGTAALGRWLSRSPKSA